MRKFDYTVLNEIKQELLLLFAAHAAVHLKGKMRLFSIGHQKSWQSHESGFDLWFGPEEVDDVLNTLSTSYRSGAQPNTPLLLDPMLHTFRNDKPVPVGSGVAWCTVLCKPGQAVPDNAVKRLTQLGAYVDFLHSKDNEAAGLKMLAFLAEPFLPEDKSTLSVEGTLLPTSQALADLADIQSDIPLIRNYLLSGLEYRTPQQAFQHPRFNDLFGEDAVKTVVDIRKHTVFIKNIRDAASCWNAYARDPQIYERYGTNIDSLQDNLRHKARTEEGARIVAKELALIWNIQKTLGLEGKMRVYTAPHQENWRSKEQGVEVWFGPDEITQAAATLQRYYNAGKLPNSPLLLDPIVYRHDAAANRYTPFGTSIVWTTSLALGIEELDPKAAERLKDIGVFSGPVNRGIETKGLKVFGILDQPYLFKDAEETPTPNIRDAISIPGCQELFEIVGVSGTRYKDYFLLSSMEYLCGHGAFESKALTDLLGNEDLEHVLKHRVSLARIRDAATCWKAYDHHHALWIRFGINAEHLERNLRYYNLCARDFTLLDATDMSPFEAEAHSFQFLVENWIPRGAVTLLAATGGAGKSTLAHRLAMITAIDWEDAPIPLWLGSKLNPDFSRGLVVYFSGEDGQAVFGARMRGFGMKHEPQRLVFLRRDFGSEPSGEPRSFISFMRYLLKLPEVSLLVIDPANKYIAGSEHEAEAVGAFFDALDHFAIEKNCAVVVLHHLEKGAKPADIRELGQMLRGTEAFFDRPRVIIGAMPEEHYIAVGLPKNSLPPGLGMVEGMRVFARDPETLDLTWLPGQKGVRSFTVSKAELKAIREQLEKEHKAG